jgi:hypothetical protein
MKEDKTEITVLFPNYTWNRFKPMDTTFIVSNTEKAYEIRVALSVLDGFEHNHIPLEIVIVSPSGQKNIINRVIAVKDKNNRHIGNVYGDVWTVEQTVYPYKEFSEAGEYVVRIHNRTQYYELFRAVSLSFIIFPTKEQKQ